MKPPCLRDMLRQQILAAERVAEFQRQINAMWTPAAQKEAIIAAHCSGKLSKDDTELLIQVYQLETA